MFYDATYLADCYILADAFRPQPGWGKRVTRVQADALPPHTDADIVEAAELGASPGYWLQRLEACGGEPHHRVVMSKSVPLNYEQAEQRRLERAAPKAIAA